MQAGSAMKIELNKLVPTASLMGIPRLTIRGMTRTGPPAPEREQIVPVTIPRSMAKGMRLSKE